MTSVGSCLLHVTPVHVRHVPHDSRGCRQEVPPSAVSPLVRPADERGGRSCGRRRRCGRYFSRRHFRVRGRRVRRPVVVLWPSVVRFRVLQSVRLVLRGRVRRFRRLLPQLVEPQLILTFPLCPNRTSETFFV